VFSLFIDQGMGQALVTRGRIDDRYVHTAFTLAMVSGILLGGLCATAAPLLAGLLGEPSVTPVVQVLALGFPLAAAEATPAALLQREMNFRTPALRILLASVVGAVAAIAVAAAGGGVWALVTQNLVGSLVGVVVIWSATAWRPRLRVDRAAARELLGFGTKILGINCLTYVNEQGSALIIGGFAGKADLGLYTVGSRLQRLVLDLFTSVISAVGLTAFSRLQDDRDRQRRAFLTAVRITGALTMPVLLTMAATAPVLLPFVFGEKWSGAVVVLQLLCVAGVVTGATYFDRALLLSLGRARLELVITTVVTVGAVLSYLCVIPWGIRGVAIATLLRVLATWPLRIWALSSLGIRPGVYLVQWARPLVACAVPVACQVAAVLWTADSSRTAVVLSTAVVSLLLVYPAALRVVAPSVLREMLQFARTVRPVRNGAVR
jgi:O-antigen/teichoic acid export membrane protein